MRPSFRGDPEEISEIEEEEKQCVCTSSPQVLVVDDNIFNIMAVRTLIEGDKDFTI